MLEMSIFETKDAIRQKEREGGISRRGVTQLVPLIAVRKGTIDDTRDFHASN